MAFPWLSEATFEANTVGHFDTEADDSNKLSIAHYSELARYPYPMAIRELKDIGYEPDIIQMAIWPRAINDWEPWRWAPSV